MAKGSAKKREFIASIDTKKPEETDTLSTTDKGLDFVKQGEVAQVSNRS